MRKKKLKKPKNIMITGEKGLGMSYSNTIIEIGNRNWYKKAQEKLIKDIEDCRYDEKKI